MLISAAIDATIRWHEIDLLVSISSCDTIMSLATLVVIADMMMYVCNLVGELATRLSVTCNQRQDSWLAAVPVVQSALKH